MVALPMLVLAVTTTQWEVIVASVCSGSLAGLISYLQGRKLAPAQHRQLEATAQQAAVEIVESALKIAQDRISSLDTEVRSLTAKIDELRIAVARSDAERLHATKQLDLALAQRAELQQQLIALTQVVGERRIDHLFSARPSDAIVIVDLRVDGKISYANDGIFGLLGYAPSELIGQNISLLIPEELREAHKKHRLAYDTNPHTRQMHSGLPLYARRRDGAKVPVDISLHPTGDGRVIALLLRRDASDQAPS